MMMMKTIEREIKMSSQGAVVFWKDFKCKCLLFSFSGAIGVGKSTAIKELERSKLLETLLLEKTKNQKLKVVIVQEPVDTWRKKGWLQSFYADPKNNALAFQILVYKTHVLAVQEALMPWKDDESAVVVCITERSMWDQLLFWKLQMDLGRHKSDACVEEFAHLNMDDDAYMQDWSLWMQCLPPVRRIFYCKTRTLEQTLQRVWLRGRREELGVSRSGEELPTGTMGMFPKDWKHASGIDYEYHKALREKHDDWYLEEKGPFEIPVTLIDMDAPFHKEWRVLEELANTLATNIIPS